MYNNMFHGYKLRQLLPKLYPSFLKRLKHTEYKVRVNDVNINIVKSGDGDRSVLLMPGALGSSWTDFKPQIEHLPNLLPNHTIISWDPPGYGKSIPPQREFNINYLRKDARYAVDLMKTLNKPKFSILGWCVGGITGLIIAGRFPNCVHKLIIWGAAAYLSDEEVKLLESIKDVKNWSTRMREPMEQLYGSERFAQLWSDWVETNKDIHIKCKGDLCIKEVDRVQAPTLILHGKKDPMIAGEHIPYLQQHLKQAKYYEFPEGKHNIHLCYVEEFNKLVANFLLEK